MLNIAITSTQHFSFTNAAAEDIIHRECGYSYTRFIFKFLSSMATVCSIDKHIYWCKIFFELQTRLGEYYNTGAQ